VTSRLKLDLKKHPDSVKVRFHIGSGTGFSGAPGWEIDDIDLVGISSKPFWSFIDHADACDEKGPVVDAGLPQTVKSEQPVTLLGSGQHPTDLPLTFVWTQLEGAPVTLTQDGSPRADFKAPYTLEPLTLTFELRANDGALLSPGARVDVVVLPPDPTPFSAGGGGCSSSRPSPAGTTGGAALLGLLVVGLFARRRLRT
jgi:MYXO-CTERM domain-containing protein